MLEYTNAWYICIKLSKFNPAGSKTAIVRSTTLASPQPMLERAWHLESTLDNNVLLQYLDTALFDQYLCKGEILYYTLIVKYLIL